MPATGYYGDLAREVLADAGQLVEVLTGGHHVGHIARQFADQPRRLAVGAHAERIGALDVEQIGNLVELTAISALMTGMVRSVRSAS